MSDGEGVGQRKGPRGGLSPPSTPTTHTRSTGSSRSEARPLGPRGETLSVPEDPTSAGGEAPNGTDIAVERIPEHTETEDEFENNPKEVINSPSELWVSPGAGREGKEPRGAGGLAITGG